MKRFNNNGMMIIPSPLKHKIEIKDKALVVKKCFCPNKHSLMTSRAKFNGHEGIMLKVKNNSKEGLVALSPIYGDNTRISLDIDLEKDEILDFFCPTCDVKLPVFSPCTCHGNLIALFTNDKSDFTNCIGVCNRVDCINSVTKNEGELVTISMINSY